MRFITLGVYVIIFWLVFCLANALTVTAVMLRINRVALALRGRRCRPRVLYLAAFFPGNAGYEARVHSWSQVLQGSGFDTEIRWCLDRQRFEGLLHHPRVIVGFHLAFLIKRFWHCLEALRFDGVIVRRELLLFNDYGGLFMERLLLALNPNVALDFDDDISVAKREPRQIGTFGKLMLESSSKFGDCLKVYRRFIVGSSYLESMVQSSNPVRGPVDIAVVPTCVDVAEYPLKRYATADGGGRTAFGWIGSVGNLKHLDLVLPALEGLSREHPLKLIVISGEPFQRDTSFEIVSVPWSYETQGASLNLIDVGLMPLCDGREERGKCGFKLIQYMACGIVSIGSAVTTNIEIIEHGLNGFLVWKQADWGAVFREVLAQKARFGEIGCNARHVVSARLTFCAQQARYVEFVRKLCAVGNPGKRSRA
jgi:glycosyltransferase involved in cell wall biosynthesis